MIYFFFKCIYENILFALYINLDSLFPACYNAKHNNMDDASCFGKLFSYPPNAMISTKSLSLITTTTIIYLEKHFQKITKLLVLLFITKNTWKRKTLINALYWPKLYQQVDYKRLRQWQHVLENLGHVLKSLGWQKHWRMDSSSYIICVYMWEFLMAALGYQALLNSAHQAIQTYEKGDPIQYQYGPLQVLVVEHH